MYLLVKLPSDECNWILLMISQHCFRYWLGAVRQQAITWANVDPDLCRHMASLCHNELMKYLCDSGTPCPPGRYGNTTGLGADTDCPLCDAGWYCPTTGLTEPYQRCTAGHYCHSGATFSNPINETWGWLCPEGYYCPEGTPAPEACPPGTYQPLTGKADTGTVLI